MDLLQDNVISLPLAPSNRPVTVFPLDQKPRWLQSAGVRGKASSIKAGMESDDMKYTGFKISLCTKDVGMDLNSCAVQIHVVGYGEESLFSTKTRVKKREAVWFFFPLSHTSCSHTSCFQERSGAQALFLCDCVSSCVPATTAVCCV